MTTTAVRTITPASTHKATAPIALAAIRDALDSNGSEKVMIVTHTEPSGARYGLLAERLTLGTATVAPGEFHPNTGKPQRMSGGHMSALLFVGPHKVEVRQGENEKAVALGLRRLRAALSASDSRR